jgi:hypothetical protein
VIFRGRRLKNCVVELFPVLLACIEPKIIPAVFSALMLRAKTIGNQKKVRVVDEFPESYQLVEREPAQLNVFGVKLYLGSYFFHDVCRNTMIIKCCYAIVMQYLSHYYVFECASITLNHELRMR